MRKSGKGIWKQLAALALALLLTASMVACGEEKKDGNGEGFSIEYNGIKVALGESAEGVVEQLGDPTTTREVFDCGEGNSRQYYKYASFELYVMNSNGKQIIDQLELTDDQAQTEKGIYIGSAESAVRSAYGEPDKESDGMLKYISDDQELTFEIENGTVSAIGMMRVTR